MRLRSAHRALAKALGPSRFSLRQRGISTASELDLKSSLQEFIREKRELLKEVKSHSSTKIGDVTIGHVLGGMRTLKSLLWEGSVLDADEGIRFHGKTIRDCQSELPKGTSGREMLPEGMLWLLLTGQVPTAAQTRALSRELAEKSSLPAPVTAMLQSFPAQTHPMTQLACAVAALNTESAFARAYAKGLNKNEYWEPVFDDTISLLAKLPRIAATIFDKSAAYSPVNLSFDWAQNFALLLGRGSDSDRDTGFQDLLRLYLALHADHEGGNVSAHATHLVGSALSDPFLSYAAGLLGLAGPLHGLAAQEVLRWILDMQAVLGSDPSDAKMDKYLWTTLNSGRVIPGYGHGVLRRPDPRFQALVDFADARPDIVADPLYQLVRRNANVAPRILKEHGKTKNPHPNVDAASGVLFHHYGFTDPLYYTVAFGVSRGIGPLVQLVWDRVLGLPIERPKSIDLKGLLALAKAEGN